MLLSPLHYSQQTFSLKSQIVNIFSFGHHMGSGKTPLLWCETSLMIRRQIDLALFQLNFITEANIGQILPVSHSLLSPARLQYIVRIYHKFSLHFLLHEYISFLLLL